MRARLIFAPLALLACMFFSSQELSAQIDTFFIVGPVEVCAGECVEYFIEGANPDLPYEWFLSNGTTITNNGPFAVICWDFTGPGVTTIFADAIVDSAYIIPLDVFVQDFGVLDIVPISNVECPANDSIIIGPPGGLGDCQKVCEGTTVTYEVNIFNPGSSFVDWVITGADSYVIENDPNQFVFRVTVDWGGPGQGLVEAYATSFCTSYGAICVDVLANPEAEFESIPAEDNGVITVCEGQTVFFENNSVGADNYAWYFDILGVSDNLNPEFTFETPGTYEVMMVARNECLCSDTTYTTVEVVNAESPIIDCVGTICAGETVTYTTNASCGTYNWSIQGGGTIVDGGGLGDDFITIDWMTGPVGFVELSVAGCAGTFCVEPMVERIPIMDGTAQIEGPESVCREEYATYTIENYDATEYFWSLSGGGDIIEGQGTNKITVHWTSYPSEFVTHTVEVNYTNCYLECDGYDSHDVQVLNEFYFSGPILVCEDESVSYIAMNVFGGPLAGFDWSIEDTDGATIWNSAASATAVNIDWTFGPGKFVVYATPIDPTDYCVEFYSAVVTVEEPTEKPDGIDGETTICPGTYYTYDAVSTQLNNTFIWTVNDGGAVSTITGNPISIAWGATGPYTLSLAQIDNEGLECISDTVSIDLIEMGLPSFTGPTDACVESVSFFNATPFENVEYEWSVNPASAGSVIAGQGSPDVEILWHSSGNAFVQLDVCGNFAAGGIEVHDLPEPMPVYPDGLCPGETVTVFTTSGYSSYEWRDGDGNLISADPNPDLQPGYYDVIVTDVFGCEGNTSFNIDAYEDPVVFISTPDNTGICLPNGAVGPTIYASETDAGYTYQWFRDGVAIGGNTNSIFAGQYGFYQVEVTNTDGCTTASNLLEVFEYCGPLSGGGGICTGGTCPLPNDCPPGTGVTFDMFAGAVCSTTSFVNTSTDMIPTTQEWDFGDGTTSTVLNPTHSYSQAGYYVVILTGTSHSTGDLCWDAKINTIPVAADFVMADACAGSPAEFTDESTFIPEGVIVDWSWDFGDPASGIDNTSGDQHPTHVFVNAGSYMVTLTVTDQSGCTSTIVEEVEIFELPTVDFPEPADNCEGTALEFLANVSPDVVEYEWDFNDPSSGPANIASEPLTYHVFENPGVYNVTLTVTSIFGCSESFTLPVTVEPNGLVGDISSTGPLTFCDGDDVDLIAPVGGISWEWSNGMITEQINVFEEDSYSVTITDADGCLYTPDPVVVDVIALPTSNIAAVEYNEYGQPVNFFYNSYSVCEGEDVTLFVPVNSNYSFVWENGDIGNETVYAEWRGNSLNVGSHTIELSITDNITGCSNMVDFNVEVNPVPTNVLIVSSNNPICEGELATLSVDNPTAGFNYVWNTGEVGTSIDVVVAGEYFVKAINQFGCSAESNRILVNAAPDISRIPSGCHTRCKPDTICLPNMPFVVSYQWYLDGSPIPGPEGNVANYVALESGVYHVEMEDFLGCTSTSDVLTLDLYDGFGTIQGNVYYDVNENGIIDGPDTLVSGVTIELQDGAATVLGTVSSDVNGAYNFSNILSTDYTLVVDTNSLPPFTTIINTEELASLFGCDDVEELNWLLIEDCPEITTSLGFSACEGETVTYNGTAIMAGDTQDFTLEAYSGCDSIITVTVAPLEKDTIDVEFQACTGTTITYGGDVLMPGTVTEYMHTNTAGCDSVVIVTVEELTEDSESVNLVACEGSSIIYDGTELFAGTTTEFNYTNEAGCDSTVTVTVDELTNAVTFLDFEVCPYEEVQYLNTILYPGDSQEFTLLDQYGCDSVVMVAVDAYPEVQFSLAGDVVCWNETSGSIAVENVTGGTAPYLYSVDGGAFQASPDLENLQGGEHLVVVQDDNGCIYERSFNLETIEPIELELEADLLLCEGPGVTIAPILLSVGSGDITYTWPDGSTDFFFEVNEPGMYYVDASNECESIRVEVEVQREIDPQRDYIYIPNAFSPDFDGVNDDFKGFVADGVQIIQYQFAVFDRWGNQLYETTNVDNGWNGAFRNQRMDTGVYVWYVDAVVESCGRIVDVFKKGDVTLVR